MEIVLFGIAAVLYIVGTVARVLSGHWQSERLGEQLAAHHEALVALSNAPGTDSATIAELRRELSALSAQVNDVDERAEARYRRLTARARRAEPGEEEEAPTRPPFPLGGRPAATNGEQNARPDGPPPLVRRR